MQRRTLLTRIIACLAAVKLLRVPFTAKLQAQTPNVPPIHVELSYWHKGQDAIIDASLMLAGTPEQLQRYKDAECCALRMFGSQGQERADRMTLGPIVYRLVHGEVQPRLIRLMHGQRNPAIGFWALAIAEALSRVGCTMTDEAAEALAACTNPNDPKATQEIRDAT